MTCFGQERLHALKGADILRREGYYEIADLVEKHHDPEIQEDGPLTEAEVLLCRFQSEGETKSSVWRRAIRHPMEMPAAWRLLENMRRYTGKRK